MYKIVISEVVIILIIYIGKHIPTIQTLKPRRTYIITIYIPTERDLKMVLVQKRPLIQK